MFQLRPRRLPRLNLSQHNLGLPNSHNLHTRHLPPASATCGTLDASTGLLNASQCMTFYTYGAKIQQVPGDECTFTLYESGLWIGVGGKWGAGGCAEECGGCAGWGWADLCCQWG